MARDLSVQGADVVAAASQEIERIARSVEDSAVVIAALVIVVRIFTDKQQE